MTSTYPLEPTPPTKRYNVKVGGQIIGKATLRSVPIAGIRIDSQYQRDTNSHWVAQHMPFDPQRAGAIVLSLRAGGMYCIDGGHRLALAKESGVSHINAFVIESLSQKDEAGLFVFYQRERRNLTSHALYRADVVRQDPDTLSMVTIVNRAGFQLTTHGGDYNITAIDAVRYIQRYGGPDLLARTLELVKRIWLGEPKALSGQVLKGLALFLQSVSEHSPTFKLERLEKIMHTTAPTKLIRLSQAVAMRRTASSTNASNVAEALHDAYQKLVEKSPTERLQPLTISKKRRAAPRIRES